MDSNNDKYHTLIDGVYTIYNMVKLVDGPHAKEKTIHLLGKV